MRSSQNIITVRCERREDGVCLTVEQGKKVARTEIRCVAEGCWVALPHESKRGTGVTLRGGGIFPSKMAGVAWVISEAVK